MQSSTLWLIKSALCLVKLNLRVQAIESGMTKKVVEKVRTQLDEREDIERRKLNVIVHNIPEPKKGVKNTPWYDKEKKEEDLQYFSKMVTEAMDMNENIRESVSDIIRLGQIKGPNARRPVKVRFKTINVKREILGKAKLLNRSNVYNHIFINPDLTPDQRKQDAELRRELKSRRDNGESNLVIKRGRIVNTETDLGPKVPMTTEKQPHKDTPMQYETILSDMPNLADTCDNMTESESETETEGPNLDISDITAITSDTEYKGNSTGLTVNVNDGDKSVITTNKVGDLKNTASSPEITVNIPKPLANENEPSNNDDIPVIEDEIQSDTIIEEISKAGDGIKDHNTYPPPPNKKNNDDIEIISEAGDGPKDHNTYPPPPNKDNNDGIQTISEAGDGTKDHNTYPPPQNEDNINETDMGNQEQSQDQLEQNDSQKIKKKDKPVTRSQNQKGSSSK